MSFHGHEELKTVTTVTTVTREGAGRFAKVWLVGVALAVCLSAWAAAPSTAHAAKLEDFKIVHVEQLSDCVRVVVDYDHPLLGWIKAGTVDFRAGGRIILSIRGEKTREVTDLRAALREFSIKETGDSALGETLALRIQRSALR